MLSHAPTLHGHAHGHAHDMHAHCCCMHACLQPVEREYEHAKPRVHRAEVGAQRRAWLGLGPGSRSGLELGLGLGLG